MIRSPAHILAAVLTAVAVVLTGGLSATATPCSPTGHAEATVACCLSHDSAVASPCPNGLSCLISDDTAVPTSRIQLDPPQPDDTALPAAAQEPSRFPARAHDALLSSNETPRGSAVALHLLYAVFLN